MNTVEKNLRMVRGDTLSFGLEFDGLEQDLDAAYFTVKKTFDGANIFQKSLGSGITKVNDGKYSVRVAPSDSSTISCGVYYYDCEITINTDVFTLLRGVIEFLPEVS